MLLSMTGYGRVVEEFDAYTVVIEIRSLNSKFSDVKVKLPQMFREKELDIRKLISDKLQRGKIDVLIEIQASHGDDDVQINRTLFKKYLKELKDVCADLNYEPADLVSAVMRLPNVVMTNLETVTEEEWEQLLKVLNVTLERVTQFRQDEGQVLKTDFELRITDIANGLEQIPAFEVERLDKLRERLRQNLEASNAKDAVDESRFEQEVLYYLEKIDITEEKVRLKQHCIYFLKELNAIKESKGKKLNFICQEIGREINTIGSKANSSDIQRVVVQMKDDLEKIKEQLANIL
jgi:uncharacterized protein (TIGR00255 family)